MVAAVEVGYRAWVRNVGHGGGMRDDVFMLYGVGESTMVGEPFDDRFSLPSLVSEMLGGVIRGRSIVIRNVAERGAGAYAQSFRLERELASTHRSGAGAVLIYSGHNEPYMRGQNGTDGAGPAVQPTPWIARAARSLLERSWLLRDAFLYRRSSRFVRPRADMHLYEWSLRRMIVLSQEAGLLPVLFTLPSNLSGIEPNSRADQTRDVAAILDVGAALERAGNFVTALDYYRAQHEAAVAANHEGALLLLYRIAHCEVALRRYADARRDFWAVINRDLRLNFGRATVAQNALVRRLAAEYGVPLVDAVHVFERNAPHGILGNDLFSDGHHPNLRGYWLLARACAGRLAGVMKLEMSTNLSTVDDIAARFGLGSVELRRANVDSGSWLLATAVYHPWPMDRMTLAEARFRAALGTGDDVSAWLGIALTQATRNGGFLRDAENVDLLGREKVYYSKALVIPPSDREYLLSRLRNAGVDADVLQQLEGLWR
jgi:tetratricopeptide (TPR) repeat protein